MDERKNGHLRPIDTGKFPEKPHEVFSHSVESLEISQEAKTTLKEAGIQTIGELVRLTQKAAVAKIGEKTVTEVGKKLLEMGLGFEMTEEQIINWSPEGGSWRGYLRDDE